MLLKCPGHGFAAGCAEEELPPPDGTPGSSGSGRMAVATVITAAKAPCSPGVVAAGILVSNGTTWSGSAGSSGSPSPRTTLFESAGLPAGPPGSSGSSGSPSPTRLFDSAGGLSAGPPGSSAGSSGSPSPTRLSESTGRPSGCWAAGISAMPPARPLSEGAGGGNGCSKSREATWWRRSLAWHRCRAPWRRRSTSRSLDGQVGARCSGLRDRERGSAMTAGRRPHLAKPAHHRAHGAEQGTYL